VGKAKLHKYTSLLAKRHKNFSLIIKKVGRLDYSIPYWSSIEDAVVYSVIGQMLSNAATHSIISRLRIHLGTSQNIISWASSSYKKQGPLLGVSQRKRRALHEWDQFAKQNSNAWDKWPILHLDDYRKEVRSIWGFGKWSADMIGIFYLGRMDIWPDNDTGIKNACKTIFGADNPQDIAQYIKDCETIAALYLWELINKNILKEFQGENR
jgi:DNA-3-methyladenine glycosylase II